MYVLCNNKFESADLGIIFDGGSVNTCNFVEDASVLSTVFNNTLHCVVYGSQAIPDGVISYISFTIPEDAELGTVYNIDFSEIKTFGIFAGEDMVAMKKVLLQKK